MISGVMNKNKNGDYVVLCSALPGSLECHDMRIRTYVHTESHTYSGDGTRKKKGQKESLGGGGVG